MNLLTIKEFSKSITDKVLFKQADFSLNEGDKIGVIGVNGTGKSTLLKIIAGEMETDEGEVIKANRVKIKYLPQNPEFPEGITIYDYVISLNKNEHNQWNVEGEAKNILNILGFTDYEQVVDNLSGGQRKRVAMAAVLTQESTLLILKREGKPEIGIVNFQVHPDVIGGTKFSADYPKFVRDTYEANVPNSLCMYINGAQGDTNHVDVRLGPDQLRGGYERSRYMGRKIAMSVISNYALAQPLTGEKVRFGQSELRCRYNKGKPEEMEDALWLYDYYKKVGHKVAGAAAKEKGIMSVPAAVRIYNLKDEPDERDLHITALAVGDAVIAGFPGEPFTEIGRSVKKHSPFTVTLTACAANSYEDYFPMQDCFDEGGYETESTLYAAGTAERMIEASLDLINTLI